MGDHGPETEERLGGDPNGQLRDVPLENGSDQVVPTGKAGLVVGGKVRARVAAAQPEPAPSIFADFRQVEAGHVDEPHSSGKRLGNTADKIGRSTSKQEELRRAVGPIGKWPEDGEEFGDALNFVEDHQSEEWLQGKVGLVHLCPASGCFQVDELGREKPLCDIPGQRGLPALAWAEEQADGVVDKRPFDFLHDERSVDHGRFLEFLNVTY
jgi:hypothetical protein